MITNKGHIALTDFGFSKQTPESSTTKTFLGTPSYMAPELLQGVPYDRSVDWWSCGPLLYFMLTGNTMYSGASPTQIYGQILAGDEGVVWGTRVSGGARGIIGRFTCMSPQKRLGALGVDEVQMHTWFRGVEWDKVASVKDSERAVEAAVVAEEVGVGSLEDVRNFELYFGACSLLLEKEVGLLPGSEEDQYFRNF
jgi:serine/threonine protein kinase